MTQQIQDGDQKITTYMNERFYENEWNLQRKTSIMETQGKLKHDLARSMNDSITRIGTRIDAMEESSQVSSTSLGTRLVVLSQKQDSQHNDLLQGLSQIDDIKTKLSVNTRQIHVPM